LTTREYCHNVISVEPKWLVEVAPQFFQVSDANKISKRKKQEKIEPLYNKVMLLGVRIGEHVLNLFQYEKADEWRLSKVKRSARSVGILSALIMSLLSAFSAEPNVWMRHLLAFPIPWAGIHMASVVGHKVEFTRCMYKQNTTASRCPIAHFVRTRGVERFLKNRSSSCR
jgi:hypothetical protein